MQLEQYIDHTLLKPTATIPDIKKLCAEANTHNFYAVCINSSYVPLAKKVLSGSKVNIAAVIGFPLGAMATHSKICEAEYCIEQGADEIDMVINLGCLKSGCLDKVKNEIKEIKEAIGAKVLKVIIETCYLTQEEKRTACLLTVEAGADFVKTSTGFGSGGATYADIQLMKDVVGSAVQLKASGGIKDKNTALRFIEMGVSRIGTSSGIAIIS